MFEKSTRGASLGMREQPSRRHRARRRTRGAANEEMEMEFIVMLESGNIIIEAERAVTRDHGLAFVDSTDETIARFPINTSYAQKNAVKEPEKE